jgi:hypothetical protein
MAGLDQLGDPIGVVGQPVGEWWASPVPVCWENSNQENQQLVRCYNP